MSDPTKAVFLSYASQDADAAKRICDALRAAGVEVWFDQSELVGGDAWDQKIRKQIRECALFVPVVSAATQARTEGYFRLEWRLADQHSHLMAKGRPFLLPVAIDATRDSEAHVPDSFLEVQWTRLLGGETPPAFAERVRKLLGGEMETGRPLGAAGWAKEARPDQRDGNVAPPSGKSRPTVPWLVPVIIGAAAEFALVEPDLNAVAPQSLRNALRRRGVLAGVAEEDGALRRAILRVGLGTGHYTPWVPARILPSQPKAA